MPCYFITGTRGSGKGAFSLHFIKKYLDEGKRVATNVDLFLEHLLPNESDLSVTRIPDRPTPQSLFGLGQAYGFNPKDPSTVNPENNGLILLDEISLFLNTKRDKEFAELMRFFVLSRKLGWDLAFVCQNKDQVDETFYKSLCDNLIICQANNLIPIPYLSNIISFFGFSGMLPDGHTAILFNGRTEMHEVLEQIPYKSKPFHKAYNTYQLFTDGTEYINDELIDMRSPFTYVPPNIITSQKFIDYHTSQIEKLKGDNTMALMKSKQKGIPLATKIKIGLMIAGAAAYFVFMNNPFDNKFLNGERATEAVPAVAPVQQPAQQYYASSTPAPVPQPEQTDDLITMLFEKYEPNLSGLVESQVMGVVAVVDFYKGDKLVQRLNSNDFIYHGYVAIPAGDSAIFIEGPNFKKRVTSNPVYEEISKPTQTASNLNVADKIFGIPISVKSE